MDTSAITPLTSVVNLVGARLLLVTPHPDDESLALGGLIQLARRHAATVSVLQVTDGDNNPWPQRVLERRWRIGAVERARWGRRRRDEVQQALACFGLAPESLRCMSWPDMGVGERLGGDGVEAIDSFARALDEAAADIIVMPDLGDRHPDHGASHVVTRLALARLQQSPVCLTYLVHGKDAHAQRPCSIALDADMLDAKREAVLAHHTQVALARKRLLAMVGPEERVFRLQPSINGDAEELPSTMPLPWQPPRVLWPGLRLTIAHADGVHVWPWRHAPLERVRHQWQLALPAEVCRGPVFAKLEMRCRSLWIFDHWGWHDLTGTTPTGQAEH